MPSSAPLPLVLPLLALLAGAACDSAGTAQPRASVPDITWLQQNAVTLQSTDPAADHADLAALGAMIGDARIVGLGEATHGTREFFRMKHRTLRYLVEEMGFSTFAIEATWAEANRINHYVLTGEGDPARLLSNLYFWTWNTAEVLEMIRWMRSYNQDPAHTRKVTFWGFDMQSSRVAMNDVVAYLRGVDSAAADRAVGWYACYRAFQNTLDPPVSNYAAASNGSVRDECRAGVQAVDSMMVARAGAFAAATGRPAYELARRAARIVVQNEDLHARPSSGVRDRYMAENVEWLAQTGAPGTRVVLWGHNLHVGRAPAWGMGLHLTRRFGDAYRIVGFSFYTGTVSAVVPGDRLRQVQTLPPSARSYQHQFHRLGLDGFIVDLRPLREGTAPAGALWLRGPLPFRQIGALYGPGMDEQSYLSTPLADEYDILIHVENSSATELLSYAPE